MNFVYYCQSDQTCFENFFHITDEWRSNKKMLNRIGIICKGRSLHTNTKSFVQNLTYKLYDFMLPLEERKDPIKVVITCDEVTGVPFKANVELPSYMNHPRHKKRGAVKRLLDAILKVDRAYGQQKNIVHDKSIKDKNPALRTSIEYQLIDFI